MTPTGKHTQLTYLLVLNNTSTDNSWAPTDLPKNIIIRLFQLRNLHPWLEKSDNYIKYSKFPGFVATNLKISAELKKGHKLCYPVLLHCWLGDRKGIRPVKKVGCWFVARDDLTGTLHVLESSLHHPCSNEIQNEDILVPVYRVVLKNSH